MKNRNSLTKLTLLFVVLLTLGASQIASQHPSWCQHQLRSCRLNHGSDCAAQLGQHWRAEWYAH